jgi:hypothetical protein
MGHGLLWMDTGNGAATPGKERICRLAPTMGCGEDFWLVLLVSSSQSGL